MCTCLRAVTCTRRLAHKAEALGQVKYTRSRLGIVWAWQQHPCSTHLAVVYRRLDCSDVGTFQPFLTGPQHASGSLSARAGQRGSCGHQVLGAGAIWTAFRRPRRAADADALSLLYSIPQNQYIILPQPCKLVCAKVRVLGAGILSCADTALSKPLRVIGDSVTALVAASMPAWSRVMLACMLLRCPRRVPGTQCSRAHQPWL